MPDKEQVINGLTAIQDEAYDRWVHRQYIEDPLITLIRDNISDALALLREQEPVRFKVTQQCRSYPFWDAECDGCGYKTSTVHRNWKYCPECGREVKWDA